MMAAPSGMVWELEPHTRAKHVILEQYLKAWMPILSQGRFPEILYIDGFAGPGKYSEGEDGSPIIALKTALETTLGYEPPLTAKLHFLFIEKDRQRAGYLRSLIESMVFPENFSIVVEGGATFEDAFNHHYDQYIQIQRRLPPTFAFVDPFGWKGIPFAAIKKIMGHSSCEVFVNFMYEEINRFLGHPDQARNFDHFFGTDSWRPLAEISDPRERNRRLHDLYVRRLHDDAGVKYVRSFEMRNERDVTDYFLFYATNSLIGLKKMKEAMWKVDEGGEFSFSDATNQDQFVLFEKSPNYNLLRRQIVTRFGQHKTTIQEIENFVVIETAFRETHYKRHVLAALEKEGLLTVINAAPNRHRGKFGDLSMVVVLKDSNSC